MTVKKGVKLSLCGACSHRPTIRCEIRRLNSLDYYTVEVPSAGSSGSQHPVYRNSGNSEVGD
jgi:hypothetical protein